MEKIKPEWNSKEKKNISLLCETVQSREGEIFNLAHDWSDLI